VAGWNPKRGSWLVWTVVAGAVAGAPALAAAGEVYAWRTDDGGYAFADDVKSIPPRYRDRAEVRQLGSLGHYPRYTAQDDRATDEYQERLAERVERLRQYNAGLAASTEAASPGAAPARQPSEIVILRSAGGSRGGVDIGVPTDGPDQPLVIETVPTRRSGAPVTEHVQVTRRGDRILSVSRPRLRVWNVSDVVDQEELLERGEAE
jgi:hypothetical protein